MAAAAFADSEMLAPGSARLADPVFVELTRGAQVVS